MKQVKLRANKFARSLAAVLALVVALSGQLMPVMAEETEAAVTEILPYQDCSTAYSGWVSKLNHFTIQDGVLYLNSAATTRANSRSRVEIPAEVQALYDSEATTPYRLVLLSRVKLGVDTSVMDSANLYADFGLENGDSGTLRIMGLMGGWESGKVFPVYKSAAAKANAAPNAKLEDSVDGWVDCAAVISGVGSSATIEYYFDGKKVDENYDVSGLAGNNFRLYTTGKGEIFFDDVHAYAVSGGNAALPLTAEELPSSIGFNDNITINFNQEIIYTDGMALINNEAVPAERVSLSADRKSIIIAPPFDGYEYGAELNVTFSDTVKGYAGGALDYSAVLNVEEAPVSGGRRIEYLPYQDFTEGYTGPAWVNKTVTLTVKDGVLAGTPTGTANSFIAIDYPAEFTSAMEKGEDAYLVLKSKIAMLSAGTGNPFAEIGIGKRGASVNATSVTKRLARIRAIGTTPQFFINTKNATETDSTKICNMAFGEEAEVAIVIHITDGANKAGTITYYKNGEKISEGNEIDLGDSEYVRLVAQNECSVYFDDVEFYAVAGGKPSFEYSGILGVNSDAGELDTNDSIQLSFTGDCIAENLVSNGVSAFRINAEAVEADRVSISPDGRSVIISAPEGGYAPQTNYEVTIASWLKDIFDTPISNVPADLSFKTGGKLLEAVITDSGREGNIARATVKLYNANSETKYAWVIMTEGTEDNGAYMMQQAQLEKIELAANSSKEVEQTLNLEHDGIAQLYVWEADVMDPILDTPLQLVNN